MTGPQSSQFVEHLRRAGHLKRTDERLDAAAPDQSQGNGTRNGPPTTNGKLWELTELSPNDFADEAARFYGLARVTLQNMLQAGSLAAWRWRWRTRLISRPVVPPRSCLDRI